MLISSIEKGLCFYMELFPSSALVEQVRAEEEGTFIGRVVRIYYHGNVCLMRITLNGIYYRAVAKKGITENYPGIVEKLKLGTFVCGVGEKQLSHGSTEVLIRQLLIISPNLLTEQETGLQEGSRFNVIDRKIFYHTYLCNDELVAMNIHARSKIFWGMRQFLHERNYIECTTPVMGRFFHGGDAQAFITHMRDSNSDMYLRVTSEIALKLIMGGSFQKVFEVGYSFRNGSVSAKYETPFYAAEIYTALITEKENIWLGLSLIRRIEYELNSIFHLFHVDKHISFLDEIPIVSFADYYYQKCGNHYDWEALKKSNKVGGKMCTETYKFLKKNLFSNQISPIIITNLPAGRSPLIHRKNDTVLSRSYLVANRATLMEFAIGENDPEILERELSAQAFKQGTHYRRDDSAFLHAHKMGMPSVASIFVGIDRIFPAFLNIENINDFNMKI